jgi:predicted DNA-binding protein (MmcQ/YjbR family)
MHRNFEALKTHAASLQGATHDIKWGSDWVASVGGKMFFVGGPGDHEWTACSFKADEHRFLELSGLEGFAPAPYLARAKWVQLRDPAGLPLADLKELVTRSYQLVLGRLTRKLQREIGESDSAP